MRLRSWGWIALTSVLLTVQPAAANPAGTSPEAVQQTATSTSVPNPGAPAEAVPAAVIPGETKPASDPAIAPNVGTEPAALQVPLIEPEPPKPVITLKVDIDLSAQRMTVMTENDEVLHKWPISSGRGGYHTPNGTWQPQWRAKMWRSRQYYGSPMPHSVFFHRGYAVHGTYATGMLGRPASHGCIRLAPKNAAAFYSLVGQHGMESTQIVVRGKTPGRAMASSGRKSGARSAQASRRQPSRGYANYGSPSWSW